MSQSPADGPDSVPPPPPGGVPGGVPAPDPRLVGQETTLQRYRRNFWARLGGQGLAVSLIIHLVALLIFGFWVVSVVTDSAKREPETFATGAGGGAAGDMAKIYEHKVTPKNARNLAKNTNRISTKSTTSSIALPDLPATSVSSMVSGMAAGGASKGFGGGSGGGIGSGKGVGVGNGRNFVGRPVMGAKIFAQKIAVYLDASGSMKPYLPWVQREIRKQFPDADIFGYNGIFTVVENGDIAGGRRSRLKEVNYAPGNPDACITKPKTLTATGRAVFSRYDEHFRFGSVGAWLDVMSREKYDALIIFSDFADGVKQYKKSGGEMGLIYVDVPGQAPLDARKDFDKRWESDLISVFSSKDKQIPLYCFSTWSAPQEIFVRCAEASKGEIKNVGWLPNMPTAMLVLAQVNLALPGKTFTAEEWVAQARAVSRASVGGDKSGVFSEIAKEQKDPQYGFLDSALFRLRGGDPKTNVLDDADVMRLLSVLKNSKDIEEVSPGVYKLAEFVLQEQASQQPAKNGQNKGASRPDR